MQEHKLNRHFKFICALIIILVPLAFASSASANDANDTALIHGKITYIDANNGSLEIWSDVFRGRVKIYNVPIVNFIRSRKNIDIYVKNLAKRKSDGYAVVKSGLFVSWGPEMNQAVTKHFARLAITRKKFDEFRESSGIKDWPIARELFANPFVYKGRVIGIKAAFKEMLSEDEGLFYMGDRRYFVVSDIPKTKCREPGEVVLAGKVLGRKDVKVPFVGEGSVLHLDYVNIHVCNNKECPRILAWSKDAAFKAKLRAERSTKKKASTQKEGAPAKKSEVKEPAKPKTAGGWSVKGSTGGTSQAK